MINEENSKIKEVYHCCGTTETFHLRRCDDEGVKLLEIWFNEAHDERDDMNVLYLTKEQMELIWKLILKSGVVDA